MRLRTISIRYGTKVAARREAGCELALLAYYASATIFRGLDAAKIKRENEEQITMNIGDKVVCIDDKPVPGSNRNKWIVTGALPAIGTFPECTGLEFIGSTAQHVEFPHLRGFNALRFRLLSELKAEAKNVAEMRAKK